MDSYRDQRESQYPETKVDSSLRHQLVGCKSYIEKSSREKRWWPKSYVRMAFILRGIVGDIFSVFILQASFHQLTLTWPQPLGIRHQSSSALTRVDGRCIRQRYRIERCSRSRAQMFQTFQGGLQPVHLAHGSIPLQLTQHLLAHGSLILLPQLLQSWLVWCIVMLQPETGIFTSINDWFVKVRPENVCRAFDSIFFHSINLIICEL